jgi:hypothetical protein
MTGLCFLSHETQDGIIADGGRVESDKLFVVANLNFNRDLMGDFSTAGGFAVYQDELHSFGLGSKR